MNRIIAPIVFFVASAYAAHNVFESDSNSPGQAVSTNCRQACSELSLTFGSAFHWPRNDNFTIWDAKQQEVHPACRVEPSSATEVSNILNILVGNWCYFSVKGGGHSRNPGDSNSIGGVTVDLDRLRTIEILQGGTKARVGGSATTIQVYEALESQNLSFVGGRVGSVGYEVVLANGTITNASAIHNLNLYFTLHSGGNNFGIVTAFTIRSFSQGPGYTSMTPYATNQSNQVLDKVYDLYTDTQLTSDKEMGYDLYYIYNSRGDEFTLSGTQRYGKPVRNPSVFRDIDRIPTLSRSTNISPMSQAVDGTDSMGTTRHLFATLTVAPSRPLLSQGLKIFQEEVEAIKYLLGLVLNFIFYPIQRNAIAAMKQRGGNALGIDRGEPLFLILISTAWSKMTDDAFVNRMTANVIARIIATAQDLGVANRFKYINYASAVQTNSIFAGYGVENVQRLKSIQNVVDPRGIFTSKGLWRGFVKLM
ncbi:FAD-binding domain-containing protein [Penicillium longicatenatum]|nr:FAD-binding domain-containing protein [Penicillium longicatenatum]